MELKTFDDNVSIHQTMGDNPNTDNGLSAQELKAKFDLAAELIKRYLNEQVVPAINSKIDTLLVPVAIDPTMTKEGYAADAKAVGEKLVGKAPAEQVKKTFFTIPASGAASIAFSGTTNAMIYCRGWGAQMAAVFNYSGYSSGNMRQSLATIVNDGVVFCGLNLESAGQGLTIKNTRTDVPLHVCIDSGIQDTAPVITYTADNAAELYVEFPNPPMLPGVEYRTTERWNGKVVYTKLIDFGNLPASGRKSVTFYATPCHIVEVEGTLSWGDGYLYTFPVFDENSGTIKAWTSHYNGSTATLAVCVSTDMSTATAQFKVKYTKD